MGGELEDIGEAPSFLISALKDPDGANLDRVQVVKGWLDSAGDLNERVYDVVWSDMEGRRLLEETFPQWVTQLTERLLPTPMKLALQN